MLRATVLACLLVLPGVGFGDPVPSWWERAWPDTDFTRLAVDPAEIFSGGPPKDGIPAITGPVMMPVQAIQELEDREPVLSVVLPGRAPRAYPIRYLTWHEIVNDRIGEVPVAVTFCPLCNSGLIFDTRVGGRELELGVSGLLRFSDMVMYDRETESWWQQFTGEAIAGEMLGEVLTPLPALMESWAAFRDAHPDGLVMTEPDMHFRPYGKNPYQGYDGGQPFLYRGPPTPHGLAPLSRVVRVGDTAWPLARLFETPVIEEDGVRITWAEGQASALDTAEISEGREVGNIRVVDAETGALVVHEIVFAFAFHAFTPEGVWRLADDR